MAQETIKMVKAKGKPIVIGELNGKKAFFLVDTGSDITIINLIDAKRYKLKYRETILKGYKLSGLTSAYSGDILIADNVDLYLGTKKLDGCYKLIDLSNLVNSMSKSARISINGIIGSDLMRKYKFLIDYNTKEISFSSQLKGLKTSYLSLR